jgi:hypothetical protein
VPTVTPRHVSTANPAATSPASTTTSTADTPPATVRTMIVCLPDGLPSQALTAAQLDRLFGVSGMLQPRFWVSPALWPWQRRELVTPRKGRPLCCAGGPVRLLDLAGMRHAAGVGAGIRFQLWQRVVHGTPARTPVADLPGPPPGRPRPVPAGAGGGRAGL